jgi:RNA polymerase sigma-70 factor, ECF subfamily
MQTRQQQSRGSNPLGGALSHVPDKSLMQMMAAGEKRALKLLYLRHGGRVFRFTVRLVGSEAVAEEIVNDVFLEAWRQADRFEARAQVATWLMSIARFKALGERRRRAELPLDEKFASSIVDTADTPAVATEKRQRSDILRACIAKLTPAHQQVINLIYYQGRNVEDAARFTGVPVNTVKSRMHYARSQLAEFLAAAGVDRAWAAI